RHEVVEVLCVEKDETLSVRRPVGVEPVPQVANAAGPKVEDVDSFSLAVVMAERDPAAVRRPGGNRVVSAVPSEHVAPGAVRSHDDEIVVESAACERDWRRLCRRRGAGTTD